MWPILPDGFHILNLTWPFYNNYRESKPQLLSVSFVLVLRPQLFSKGLLCLTIVGGEYKLLTII